MRIYVIAVGGILLGLIVVYFLLIGDKNNQIPYESQMDSERQKFWQIYRNQSNVKFGLWMYGAMLIMIIAVAILALIPT